CIIALLWSILARTGTRLDRKVQRYRFERGMESGGFGRALASAPGAVLASALTSIASFILPAIAAVATLVLVRLDIAGLVPSWGSEQDRKSTRLNSSHVSISYAVFCLKKKKNQKTYKLTREID